MARFLRLVVDYSLEGRGGELKEYLIGVEVFDRRKEFDPRLDPIVRVEARRLRKKLTDYYSDEGRHETLRIALPKGAYVPIFETASRGQPAEAPAAASIAVLPLQNLSQEPDNEYFSDGLTEELIHALTKIPNLRVVAWNSSAQWKGRAQDAAEAGREMRAKYVLSGSVRRAGGRVRILARLIDSESGQYLWSENYDRSLEDLFAIQREIGQSIADTLQVRLAPAEANRYNLDAYNWYLKGRFHLNTRTREGFEQSIRCYEEALRLDRTFALAFAGLADSYVLQGDYGLENPMMAGVKAKNAAERALAIDPTLGEAETCLAMVLGTYHREWREAEAHYRRALQMNPNYATAHHWFGLDHLSILGRFEEGRAELDIAVALDPLSAITQISHGYLFMLSRNLEESLKSYEGVLAKSPGFYKVHTSIGRVYSLLGRYAEAIEMLEHGRRLGGDVPSTLGALIQVLAVSGNRERACALFAQLEAMSRTQFIPNTTLAIAKIGFGENEAALDLLEAGVRQHEPAVTYIGVSPVYDPLRRYPRFQRLLVELGLA